MTTSLADEHAIRAWTRRHSGAWTEADELRLQAWLEAAPENRVAYDQVAGVWAETGALAGRFPRTAVVQRTRRRRIVAAICATLLIVVSGGAVTYEWWQGRPQQLSAGHGKPREITLQDGTRVILDGGSELVVRLRRHERYISLTSGEALFTVTHDPQRPFVVESGAGKIVDVGTRFDVETTAGWTRISVLEGRVDLGTSRGTVALAAGRSGGYDNQGVLSPVGAADESVTLWSTGRRRFNSEPLPEVLDRLARYHGVSFVLSHPSLQKLRVSGTFRVDDLSLFLRTLSAALPLRVTPVGSKQFEIEPVEPR